MPKRKNKNSKLRIICKIIKWIPVLFLMAIIGWSYYAYVIQLCFYTIELIPERIAYLVVYHILFVLFMWSYLRTICTDIGKVPEYFQLPEREQELLLRADSAEMEAQILGEFAKGLPITNRSLGGEIRYCKKCQNVKPDRAHHCSVCGECVLKMDHHCPWINNCVSFTNYKYFVIFIFYGCIYCVFICLTSVRYFLEFWKGNMDGLAKFHILLLLFVALVFVISLASLFGYHCYLIYHNRTTLEAFRPPVFDTGPDEHGYDLGPGNNFKQVFGDDHVKWFFPIKAHNGDGVLYPIRSTHWPYGYRSMDSTVVNLHNVS